MPFWEFCVQVRRVCPFKPRLAPLDGELRDEGEVELSSAIGQQLGKGVADLGFVVEMKLAKLMQVGVVILDGGVRRFEG